MAARPGARPPQPWSQLLPELRARTGTTRGELVRRLAARSGVADREPQVAGYVHELETGQLQPEAVRPAVVAALAAVLGVPAALLRIAGRGCRRRRRRPSGGLRAARGRAATATDHAAGGASRRRLPRGRPVRRRSRWMRSARRGRARAVRRDVPAAGAAGGRGRAGREPCCLRVRRADDLWLVPGAPPGGALGHAAAGAARDLGERHEPGSGGGSRSPTRSATSCCTRPARTRRRSTAGGPTFAPTPRAPSGCASARRTDSPPSC